MILRASDIPEVPLATPSSAPLPPLDKKAVLRYIFGTAFQFSLITLFMKGVDVLLLPYISKLGATVLASVYFAFMSLRYVRTSFIA